MTREEMIESGRNVGATFAVIHTSLRSDVQIHAQVEYVYSKKEADARMKDVQPLFVTEVIDLQK